jgi:hypothetical protein
VQSRKINLEKVIASLVTICVNCGYDIDPSEIKRVNSREMECQKCYTRFEAGKKQKS